MAAVHQVYKCEECGNIVEVVHAGGGELVCCGHPMKLMKENFMDAAVEKHVPVVTIEGDSLKVAVGSVAHPMEEVHFIEWIELIAGDVSEKKWLHPGEAPEAVFVKPETEFTVRAYCNLHGLWKNS